MQSVSISDLEWKTTLPRIIAPLSHEWLPGLMLRCDEINGWESGRTARYILRASNKFPSLEKFNPVMTSDAFLKCTGQVLALSVDDAKKTTFRFELDPLTGITRPGLNRGHSIYTFYLCSECVAQQRLLRRTLALPHIMSCPQHHVMLQTHCQCGWGLGFFLKESRPFACPRCDLDWGKLPSVEASSDRIELEQKLHSYYTFFFSEGTPELLFNLWKLIRKKVNEQAKREFALDDAKEGIQYLSHKTYYFNPSRERNSLKRRISLGYIAYSMVDLQVSLDEIRAYAYAAT